MKPFIICSTSSAHFLYDEDAKVHSTTYLVTTLFNVLYLQRIYHIVRKRDQRLTADRQGETDVQRRRNFSSHSRIFKTKILEVNFLSFCLSHSVFKTLLLPQFLYSFLPFHKPSSFPTVCQYAFLGRICIVSEKCGAGRCLNGRPLLASRQNSNELWGVLAEKA